MDLLAQILDRIQKLSDLPRLLTDLTDVMEWYKLRNGSYPSVVIDSDLATLDAARAAALPAVTNIMKAITDSVDAHYPVGGLRP